MKKALYVFACLSLLKTFVACENATVSPYRVSNGGPARFIFPFLRPVLPIADDTTGSKNESMAVAFEDINPTERGSWLTSIFIGGAHCGFLRGKLFGTPKQCDGFVEVTMHQNAVVAGRWGLQPESWVTYKVTPLGGVELLCHFREAPEAPIA